MNASDPQRSARDELREQLLQAARREQARRIEAAPARRRRSRRSIGLVVAVLFGAAAAAGAADLISTGEPVPDSTYPDTEYAPATPGALQLDAKAPDPHGGQGWGVATYTSKKGEACAVAGQLRGNEVGEVRDGTFHAYAKGTTGTCGNLERLSLFHDLKHVDGLTIVFGRTAQPDHYVIALNDGQPVDARPGHDGAFIWVFDGKLGSNEVQPKVGAKIHP